MYAKGKSSNVPSDSQARENVKQQAGEVDEELMKKIELKSQMFPSGVGAKTMLQVARNKTPSECCVKTRQLDM